MRQGVDVIYQGCLRQGSWGGRPDLLRRVERPSGLGPWSYEVIDCKLASETKAETILQLCLYGELLGDLQGAEPEQFHVIRPATQFVPESYRTAAFSAYYRAVKRSFEAAVQGPAPATYPEPVNHCEMCRWWKRCDTQRRRDDHLSLVAGATKAHRKELLQQNVETLATLAAVPLPIPFRPSRGARESYTRIREQARVQLDARLSGERRFELLAVEAAKGLARLPEPSDGDLFLDFEGDPFVEDGGREYLFGVLTADGTYHGRWALDRQSERAAFEWLIDLAHQRLVQHPGLHIYHFGGYETGAVKRLMRRYATRETQVDELLRGEVFVDLHSLTRQSLRASVEHYSLKALEQFCGFSRAMPLADANPARHLIEHQLELGPAHQPLDAEAVEIVERYNEDDCRATERLRQWLEELRAMAIAQGTQLARPVAPPLPETPEATEQQAHVAAVFQALTAGLPEEPAERTPTQAAQWLLAHALDWHRREEKVKWWEFFRLRDLAEEDLFDEKAAIGGLEHLQRLPKQNPRERSPIDRYAYPLQECSIRPGDEIYTPGATKFGEVVAADPVARTVDIKKPAALDTLHPNSVFSHTKFPTKVLSSAVLRLAEWIVAHGMDSPAGEFRAARDLLLRFPPRLTSGQTLERADQESTIDHAVRIGLSLDRTTFPIQGPPGAGKTYTGARIIASLVAQGKRVGVTAVSHKVIRNLLDGVIETGASGLCCAHLSKGEGSEETGIRAISTNPEAHELLTSGEVNVLGGTPWLWARPEFAETVDVLVVDEAGQMSLANVLACAAAGKSLVLLGDPQQLEQPQQGSHPEGSDISALAHLLGGARTLHPSRGLFLGETWRLHPTLCRFTSELFYEGRLQAHANLVRQALEAPAGFSGAGLWFLPLRHEGNQSNSPEEVDAVARLVDNLQLGHWINAAGETLPVTSEDILIVAPYNDQVNLLQQRLPQARVGTVDKFQGQQAAVVIYSLSTSSPEDAPRGMEFLYNLNRFNVATSRARCACIVMGSPRLLAPECRTPRQMELANALCRYVELSTRIAEPAARPA